MLAEQIGDAIARCRGLNAGFELPAQLNPDRAREHSADQDDQAARRVIPDIGFGIDIDGGMIEHRHPEQLRRRDEAGEGREPEVEPQRRKNDEDEIGQWHHETQRQNRSHVFDVQGQRDGWHGGFDQRAEISPEHRHVAVQLQIPADDRMHPQLEQNEWHQDHIEVSRPQTTLPDVIQRFRLEDEDGPEDDGEKRGGCNQRLDPDQLGPQHFLRQGMLEIGRYRRALPVCLGAPEPSHHVTPSFRDTRGRRPGISRFRVRSLRSRPGMTISIVHQSSVRRKRVTAIVMTSSIKSQ